MPLLSRCINPRRSLRQLFTTAHCFSNKLNFSSSPAPEVLLNHHDEECVDFLPWLEGKAGVEISSKLYVGKSACGRSLFASKSIQTGDCILRVPYNVQIAPDNLLPRVASLLDNETGNVAKLATIILIEQKRGQESEWAPLYQLPPQVWRNAQHDILEQKLSITPPEILDSITLEEFHACICFSYISSMGKHKGISLIFANHDGCHILISDFAPHEEVLIRYGKFSNATLLLEFGFIVLHNIHDQVQIHIDIPNHDFLGEMKLDIFNRHHLPTTRYANGPEFSGDSFIIKEVRSARGKRIGLPQSLHAFLLVFFVATLLKN
ncbi:hypothetical protein OIU85_006610 [Salix viminalis]|uniref:SET domain-containing protein n=1 Tax=Salix viminalis TaxID=40686 RepID=A0A9Q0PLD4_SALVM|nr:hypothetical protein OIU85_006610 [Salix viminalis]